MKRGTQVAVLLGIALTAPALAQKESTDHSGYLAEGPAQSTALSEGEVRKVDKDAKKITIKHGPLTNHDMPAMTMVFQVQDPKMLGQVKAGDKVKFRVERLGGAYTITRIDATN